MLDPNDNEIEVYYEMPKSQWQWPADKGLSEATLMQSVVCGPD